jgi:hypothetical protein
MAEAHNLQSKRLVTWCHVINFVYDNVSHGSKVLEYLDFSDNAMNLSLYSINAFIILDTEGHRVLAKYYRPKSHPQGESKGLLTLKEQKAFEKGLWQKTKKPGGSFSLYV